MALQAPERRGKTTIEEDLARAFALSQADKRLGEYFPPVENLSHEWHYDGTEHTGGGFESDMYAFRTRGQVKKEFEVSVVQWARERDVADQAWAAEEAARGIERRNEDRKMKSLWAPEEADIIEARREAEKAWAKEQMELEGLAPTKDQGPKPKKSSPPTMIDARRLNETLYRPNLGEVNPTDRTTAWLSGRGEKAGIKENRMDPTEQNEIHTMDVYEEELRRRRSSRQDTKPRSHTGNGDLAHRKSMVSSKPPSLPSKSVLGEEMVMSPASASQVSIDQTSSQGPPLRLESPSASEFTTPVAQRRQSMKSMKSIKSGISAPETTIPPSLPSKGSGRGSPDSMETESRRSPRSAIESLPEPIDILSPEAEENQATRFQSRPSSSTSRRIESFVMHNKEPIMQERPISYNAMMTDSWVDLKSRPSLKSQLPQSLKSREQPAIKSQEPSLNSREEDVHVRSSSSSWRFPVPENNELLVDETIISGLPGTSEPSMTTLVAADRFVSPASQIAQSYRQMVLEASADPTNSIYLRDMPFTVPSMFSRSVLQVTEEVGEETEDERAAQRQEEARDDPSTPRQRPTSIPPHLRFPAPSAKSSKPPAPSAKSSKLPGPSTRSPNPPVNVDKSLPGTPYTMTHSIVSTPEFDADALESAQRTDDSYYRRDQDSLPPGYSSGSKTPRGSLLKSQRDSYGTLGDVKEYGKSATSLRSAKTSSTGAMGDIEAQEVLNPVRGAERRPSKRSSQRPHKPEGSVTSEGSGSTVKASKHSRSQSSASDDGRRLRETRDAPRERSSASRINFLHQRSRSDLPPGSAHTRISLSDSESGPENDLPPVPDEAPGSPTHSSPMSVDISDDDGGQYANVPPEVEEARAPGRMSGQTFGLPTGTNMTFDNRDSRDWKTPYEPINESKVSLGSRPQSMAQSMAPSTRSNRTRASTLRASMKSPLANISERDTASELSFRGEEIHESGSFGVHNESGSGESNEPIPVEPEEEESPMDKYGMGPAWRAELWGSVAWDAAAHKRGSSTKRKMAFDEQGNILPVSDKKSATERKSSSSSLGDELKDNFTLGHGPDSYHGSQRNSVANPASQRNSTANPVSQGNSIANPASQRNSTVNPPSSGMEDQASSGNKGQSSSAASKLKHNVGEVIEWHEDTEVGMAGIGAHGIRAKVSYKEPTPEESDGFTD